jgi:hypothetical protein
MHCRGAASATWPNIVGCPLKRDVDSGGSTSTGGWLHRRIATQLRRIPYVLRLDVSLHLRCVAPHTAKIHTLITLGFGIRAKALVLKPRTRRPCGFDSHRPLHFSLSGVVLCCPRTRPRVSPSCHSLDMGATVHLIERLEPRLGRSRFRWARRSVIDPKRTITTVSYRAVYHAATPSRAEPTTGHILKRG